MLQVHLTALDVSVYRKRIASITSSFPVGDWLFNNIPFTVSEQPGPDFYGILYVMPMDPNIPAVK